MSILPTKKPSTQNLTPDVLFNIFMVCVDLDFFWYRKCSSPSTMQILASVCKSWREIALRNSFLWGNIRFAKFTKTTLSLLKIHLERSKDSSLILGLNLGGQDQSTQLMRDPRNRRSPFQQIFGELLLQQHRWRRFGILRDAYTGQDTINNHWEINNLPLTEELIIRTPINEQHNPLFSHSFELNLSKSFKLESLYLHGDIRLRWDSPSRLESLTNIQLEHKYSTQQFPNIADCLTLLSCTPNIQYLLIYPSNPPFTFNSLPHVNLEHLIMLEIGSHGVRKSTSQLLPYLTLPNLEHLCICNESGVLTKDVELASSREQLGSIDSLLHRSGAKIKYFLLDSNYEDELSLIGILESMTYLIGLSISSCTTLSKQLFDSLALAGHSDNRGLCPDIEQLKLENCAFGPRWIEKRNRDPLVLESLKNMIVSRKDFHPSEPRLRSVDLRYCNLFLALNSRMVRECTDSGLVLNCVEETSQ